MDDFLMLPTPGPRKGRIVISVSQSEAAGKAIAPPAFEKLFTTKRVRFASKVRPVFDPEAPTMGPWA